MDKNTLMNMSGEELWDYFTYEEYNDLISLLQTASPDPEVRNSILERIVREGKQLAAVYPGEGEKPKTEWEYIGEVIDGALYLF